MCTTVTQGEQSSVKPWLSKAICGMPVLPMVPGHFEWDWTILHVPQCCCSAELGHVPRYLCSAPGPGPAAFDHPVLPLLKFILNFNPFI